MYNVSTTVHVLHTDVWCGPYRPEHHDISFWGKSGVRSLTMLTLWLVFQHVGLYITFQYFVIKAWSAKSKVKWWYQSIEIYIYLYVSILIVLLFVGWYNNIYFQIKAWSAESNDGSTLTCVTTWLPGRYLAYGRFNVNKLFFIGNTSLSLIHLRCEKLPCYNQITFTPTLPSLSTW